MSSTVLVGARLRHLREERGLSQAELARRLDLSPSYLNQLERDKRPLTVPVLLRIQGAFGVDADFFAPRDASRLTAELREALLDDAVGADLGATEIADIAERHPELARAVIGLRRRYRDAQTHMSAVLGDRGVTAAGGAGGAVAAMPHELVRDFFYDHGNYFHALDVAAEELAAEAGTRAQLRAGLGRLLRDRHHVRVLLGSPDTPAGELRRFDPVARTVHLADELRAGQQAFQLAVQLALLEHGELLDEIAAESGFDDPVTLRLTRLGLAHYFAAAVLLPYERLLAAAEVCRYDVERLATTFNVGFEVVCHRLSSLQRPGRASVPFSFVRVDRAGNLSKRLSASGFHFSRSGGTCPLWTVYEAFSVPGRILRQVAEMPDGRTYFWIARTVARRRTGFNQPEKTFSIGLGCELRDAHRLVYSDGLALDDRAIKTPIGTGCKTCDRPACPQRAFPPAQRELMVDEHRTTFAPYRAA